MTIRTNVSLLPFNTFGIEARAAHFAEVYSIPELTQVLQSGIRPVRIWGGGSNILLSGDQEGLIVRNCLKGITVEKTFARKVWVKAGGGEVWHNLVLWTIQQGFGGLENLSLIPGTVGAAPVQNIGAYGVEIKDHFVYLEAIDLKTGRLKRFSKKACAFGYRDSFFKKEGKGRYAIVSVVFSLTRNRHQLRLSYGDITRTLAEMGVQTPDIKTVSDAVIRIRSSKLPDPANIGNCGSFFKNPEVARDILVQIQKTHPLVVFYDLPDGKVKIPAGWLIEQCGWKGKRIGNTGCYEKQALVLVNYGGATGREVTQLAQDIIQSVKQTFNVQLEPEVNIW